MSRPLLLVLAACAQEGTLAPDQDLAADAMLATFPADITLAGGAGPALAALLDEPRAEQARLGCGRGGCAVLVEGAFDATDLDGLREQAEGAGATVRFAGAGFDLVRGGRVQAVRLLAPGKAVLGDGSALARLEAAQAARDLRFDPGLLAGAVPRGDLWLAGWEIDLLAAQAAERLAWEEAPAAFELARRLRLAAPELDRHADDIDTIALSLELAAEGSGVLRLRVSCAGTSVARAVERRLERLVEGDELPAALSGAGVARAGRQVEATATLSREQLRLPAVAP